MRDATEQDQPILRLFEGYGIELEYMIVDNDSLSVLPVTDEVLKAVAGKYVSDVEEGPIAWSNEIVLHVIELKTNGPAAGLEDLPDDFQADLRRVRDILRNLGGRLMPTGMHPWMNPFRETRLWPHAFNPIYETFNRIFDCNGHGWSNLQSMHLNLPFSGDEEFGKLHAATRLVLPILPALAASTPVVEGQMNGILDNRLESYRTNSTRIPSVCAQVIPEPVFTRSAYESEILDPIYRDIDPYDGDGILRHEWINARGAIARFDRSALEIRVLDMQECALSDIAIAYFVVAVVRALVEEQWVDLETQKRWSVARLAPLFRATIRNAERTRIEDREYLELFGLQSHKKPTAGELWQHLAGVLFASAGPEAARLHAALQVLLDRGPLARRITNALDSKPSSKRLFEVYLELCDCLDQGRMFVPE